MTNVSRGVAALTIFAVAGFTAGCSSPAEAPTKAAAAAPAKKAAPAAPAKKAAAATPATKAAPATPAKTAYCAPLAAAFKVKPASGQATSMEAMQKYGKLLEPAAAAASAAGKKDVGEFLSLTAKMSSDPMHATAEQGTAAFAAMGTVYPIILKDCGLNILK